MRFCACRNSRNLEHPVQIAVQLHRAALATARAARLHYHLFDKRTDRRACCHGIARAQMLVEIGDRAAINRLVIGRQAHDLPVGCHEERPLECCLVLLQSLDPRGQCARRVSILLDLDHQLGNTGANIEQFRLEPVSVGIGGECRFLELLLKAGGEAADKVGREQSLADAGQRACLQFARADRAVAACAGAIALAAPAAAAARQERLIATAASHQPRQEMTGFAPAGELAPGQREARITRRSRHRLSCLDAIPQRLVYDPQAGLVADDPFGFRIEARLPAEAALLVGHLDPGSPVEDPPADIDFVVQDAFAKGRITRQGCRVPDAGIVPAALAGARGWYTLRIQNGTDLLEAMTGGIQLEDAPDEVSLLLVDRQPVALATLRVVADDLASVAEDPAAGSAAAHRLALQPPPGRVGDAHALLLADDALERHHQIVEPAGYHRVHHHPVKPEQLHHVHQMLGVAAQPVDILDDEDADTAAGDQRQHVAQAGPFHRRAGDAVIAVKGDEVETMVLGIAFGEQALVGNRGGTIIRVVEALAAIGNGSVRHGSGPFDVSDQ